MPTLPVHRLLELKLHLTRDALDVLSPPEMYCPIGQDIGLLKIHCECSRTSLSVTTRSVLSLGHEGVPWTAFARGSETDHGWNFGDDVIFVLLSIRCTLIWVIAESHHGSEEV
jgi:hypothetical protein